MYGYIYKTTNLINGKIYIGMHHGNFDPLYRGSGKLLKQAVSKYGIDNFSVAKIDECESEEEMDRKEIYWISIYNSTDKNIGYNILKGGINGYQQGMHSTRKGTKLPEDVCIKMSLASLGKKKSQLHRQHIRECRLNTHLSSSTKQKISETLKKTNPNTGSIWIKNVKLNKSIKLQPELAQPYFEQGWVRGRIRTWVNQYEK